MSESSVSHALHAAAETIRGSARIPGCSVFGFKVNPCTQEQLLDYVFAASGGQRRVVASLNMHGLYMCTTNTKFRAVHERELTISHIDGIPVIWLAKLAGLRLTRQHRTRWNDFFSPLLVRAAAERRRVYYLGSTPQVVERGLERIRNSLADLQIVGRHGYFDPHPDSSDCRAIVGEINRFAPDILVVGMGMPRQEEFIYDMGDVLAARVIMTSGAAMEVLVGDLPRAPRWISDLGLEGPFRLLYSPRRTWRRYLVEPWIVLFEMWRHYSSAWRRRDL